MRLVALPVQASPLRPGLATRHRRSRGPGDRSAALPRTWSRPAPPSDRPICRREAGRASARLTTLVSCAAAIWRAGARRCRAKPTCYCYWHWPKAATGAADFTLLRELAAYPSPQDCPEGHAETGEGGVIIGRLGDGRGPRPHQHVNNDGHQFAAWCLGRARSPVEVPLRAGAWRSRQLTIGPSPFRGQRGGLH